MKVLKLSIRPMAILGMLALVPFVAHEAAVGAEASYSAFLVPGALGTFPMGVNNLMAVTGYYTTSPSTAAGFVRLSDGTITTFSIPGSLWTEPEGINNLGDVTGFYEAVSGIPQGFIRYADGRVVTFDPTAGLNGPQAQPVSINDFDEVAGNYPFPNVASAGFARSRTGNIATIDYSQGASYATVVTGLNNDGAIVGYCSDCSGDNTADSFLLHPDGYTVRFAVPVSGPISSETTIAEDINNDGIIAGWYGICTNHCINTFSGGFVRSPQGVFTLFNPPGAIVAPARDGVFAQDKSLLLAPRRLSLNAEGVITGSYEDASAMQHGFVRNPYGIITSFDPPRGMQTTATSINDCGVVAGSFYYDWNSQTSVGFLRIPAP